MKHTDKEISAAITAFAPFAKSLAREMRVAYKLQDDLVVDAKNSREFDRLEDRIMRLEKMADRIDRIQKNLPDGMGSLT